jgi:hypothetical protein
MSIGKNVQTVKDFFAAMTQARGRGWSQLTFPDLVKPDDQ